MDILKPIRQLFFALALLVFIQAAQAQTGFWSTASSTGFTARFGHTSSVVGGKIYVIGGAGDAGFLNSVEVFDPPSDTWTTPVTTGVFRPHFGHTAAVVDEKIYLFGGVENNVTWIDSVSVFDPSNNSWATIDPGEKGIETIERYGATSSVVNGKIYVIGGGYSPYTPTNVIEIFDPKTRRWSFPEITKDSMLPVVTPVSCVIDGKIYVIGDPPDQQVHAFVQVYEPQTNKWDIPSTAIMNVSRVFFSANEINGKIYAIGGGKLDSGSFSQGVTEVYDTLSKKWDTVVAAGTFTKRVQLTSNAIGNKIYVIGGEDYGIQLNSNEVLNLPGSGVEQNSHALGYNHRIYPNPATTTLNLVSIETSSHFKIIDILGRTVISGMTGDHKTSTIDISTLPRGIYYILVQTNDMKGAYVIAGKFAAVNP